MKLRFDVPDRHQADPYILADEGMYYIYVSGDDGVEAYECETLQGVWRYKGIVCSFENCRNFWAPSIIKYEGTYYMYVSCDEGDKWEHMMVVSSDSPLGPFSNRKELYDRFSIDSHIVQTEAGLFLFYAEDNKEGEKIGTRIFVDKMIDPYTPAHICREILTPSFPEEMFESNRYGDGRDWYTLEGAFWFREGEYQYLIYSAGCYMNDTYHLGYAVAKSDEADLTKVDWTKHSANGKFDPLMIKNEYEEGTGHNSVIKIGEQYYVVYHARDYEKDGNPYWNHRTGRICPMQVKDGILTLTHP